MSTPPKYIITDESKTYRGETVFRIKACRDFSDVKAGTLGGWIAKPGNLDQAGNCWVYDQAVVQDDARVFGNATVLDNACVSGNAWVWGDSVIKDNAMVYDYTKVFGEAVIKNNAMVYDNALISDNAIVYNNAKVCGETAFTEGMEAYGEMIVSETPTPDIDYDDTER